MGFVSALPLTGAVSWGGINVEGYLPEAGQELQADQRIVQGAYFEAMRIPLVKGRYFSEHDTSDSQSVAVIDDNFARRFWRDSDPIGKHLWFDPKKPILIIGVVGNVKQYGLDNDAKIATYFPQSQNTSNGMYMTVRSASATPATLSGPIAGEIHAVDSNIPVYESKP